ncbi:acyl-CoA thioesterase [Natrialbaceae archaeon A-arb3/5]
MTAFDYEVSIDVRLRDIDFMGHVNNAIYATYLEEARESYFRDVLDVSLTDVGTVLVSLEIEYRQPIEADSTVEVALAVPELGESSVPIEYEIQADGEQVATARTVQVLLDEETGDSKTLPPDWRTRVQSKKQ